MNKKQKKKVQKILNWTVLTLLIITICLSIHVYISVNSVKYYAMGLHSALGNEGMCERIYNTSIEMDGEYCIVNRGHLTEYNSRYINCSWINLRVDNPKENYSFITKLAGKFQEKLIFKVIDCEEKFPNRGRLE